MAKTYEKDDSRGTFDKRIRISANGADMRSVFEEFVEARKPARVFEAVEELARRVLALYGFPEWPIPPRYDSDGRQLGFGIPKAASPEAKDANDLLFGLQSLNSLLSTCKNSGDGSWIAVEAYSIGRTYERLRLRVAGHEQRVQKHMRLGAGGKKGGKKTATKNAARAEGWQELVDQKQREGMTHTRACEEVAHEVHADRKTVISRTIDKSSKK